MYKVYQLSLPVLKEWPYPGVLCGSEVQSPLSTRARHSMAVPYVGCLCPLVWCDRGCCGAMVGVAVTQLAVRLGHVAGALSRACPLVLAG